MVTIRLKHFISPQEEYWLMKNVGRRLHYTHQSIGGEGWIAKKQNIHNGPEYTLTFEDERFASFFLLIFPQ